MINKPFPKNIPDLLYDLIKTAREAEVDIIKFERKGIIKAGVRARKKMSEVKEKALNIRMEIQKKRKKIKFAKKNQNKELPES